MATTLGMLPGNTSTIVSVNLQEMLESINRNMQSVTQVEKLLNMALIWLVMLICLLTLYALIRIVFRRDGLNSGSRVIRHEILSHAATPASVTWSSYRPEKEMDRPPSLVDITN